MNTNLSKLSSQSRAGHRLGAHVGDVELGRDRAFIQDLTTEKTGFFGLLLGSLAMGAFYGLSVQPFIDDSLVIAWLAGLFAVNLIRAFFRLKMFGYSWTLGRLSISVNMVGSGLSALCWGGSLWLFCHSAPSDQTLVYSCVLFVMAAASTGLVTNWAHLSVALVGYVLVIVPLILGLVVLGALDYLFLIAVLSTYSVMVLGSFITAYLRLLRFFRPAGELAAQGDLMGLSPTNDGLDMGPAIGAFQNERLLFQQMVDSASGLMISFSTVSRDGGQVLYANRAFCDFLGVTVGQVIGGNPTRVFHMLDDLPWVRDQLLAGERVEVENRVQKPDGQIVPVEVYISTFTDLQGARFAITYVRDISDKKAAEEQKLELQARLANEDREREFQWLANVLPDQLVQVGNDRKVQYISKLIADFFGLSVEQFLGNTIEVATQSGRHPRIAKRFADTINLAFESGELHIHERWFSDRGERHKMEHRAVPELNDEGKVERVILLSKDITRQSRVSEVTQFIARGKMENTADHYLQRLTKFLCRTMIIDVAAVAVHKLSRKTYEFEAIHSKSDLHQQRFNVHGSLLERASEVGFYCLAGQARETLPEDKFLALTGCDYAVCARLPPPGNGLQAFLIISSKQYIADPTSTIDILEFVAPTITAELVRKLLERQQRKQEAQFRALVENSPDVIMRFNSRIERVFENSVFSQLGINWKTSSVIENGVPKEGESLFDKVSEVVDTGNESRINISVFDYDSRARYFDCRIVPEFEGDNQVIGAICISRDVSDQIKLQEDLRRQATLDALTGLPNRRSFSDKLNFAVKQSKRSKLIFGVFFIDLDRFKEVNDTLGHEVGDSLLVEAAERIQSAVRETDVVARFGGDEFVILLQNITSSDSLGGIAAKLIRELSLAYHLAGRDRYISASIGIAMYPDDADSSESLVACADQAMYAAKNQGRSCYRFFTAQMQLASDERMSLVSDLGKALARNELYVVYQPIVDARTKKCAKVEVLLRWWHPVRGLISPSEFIPLAEETGLIVDIGNWVFRQSLAMVKEWRDQTGRTEVQVAVNMSSRQLYDEGIAELWQSWLHEYGLPGECVTIELTETMLLEDFERVRGLLAQFQQVGMQLALDDFGTGYSAMAYLKKFSIDYLKVDGSFVLDLELDESDRTIAETIILMASKLGMKSVAECVETPEQQQMLIDFGCDYLQGFLFSKPVRKDEFLRLPLAAGCESLDTPVNGAV